MDRELENFRALIVLSGVSLAMAIGVSYLPMPLAEGQESVLFKGGAGAIASSETSELLWWAWVALYSLAHALAFGFVWWSKPVYLFTFALAVTSSALNGLFVGEPWGNTLWALHNAAATFAIGMLFFSPAVRQRMQEDFADALSRPPHQSPPTTPVVTPTDSP